MNKKTIYTRTAKGAQAAASSSRELANDLRKVLDAIDGTSSIEVLQSKLNFRSAAWLDRTLAALVADDLIREAEKSTGILDFTSTQSGLPTEDSQRKAQELREKLSKARLRDVQRSPPAADVRDRESEENALLEAAERTRQEAEEQARQGAEEESRREAVVRAQKESEERARRDAEEEARRKAAERARQEAEEQAKRDADEKTKREAAERTRKETEEKTRRDAEEEARRNAAERAREEAEEQTRRDAEEEARRKAAERTQKEAEERARRDAEEEAGRKAAELAKKEVEERARRDAEEQREAAERARKSAEVQARLKAEEQAWIEAEEKTRREEAEASRLANARAAMSDEKAGSKKPRNWGMTIALGLVALVVLALVTIHLISFDGQIPQFEKTLAGQFQQPVKIKALHLSLLPPHLRLEGVSIGSEGQIRIPRINAAGELGNLFSDKKAFKSLELDSPVVTEEGLGWILLGKALGRDMVFGQVSALNASLESKNISLPAFEAKLKFDGEGAWQTIALESMDKNLSLELTPKGQSVQIDIKARSFKIPFGSGLTLDEMVAAGIADRSGLTLMEFKGFAYGGTLSGDASLKWGANWSLAGELNAKQIDTARMAPELMDGGRVAGKASYSMQAPEASKLFSTLHLEGNFAIPRGTLLGVSLGGMLQGGSARGETKFTDLTGTVVHDRGATQLRQVRLSEGSMSASGTVDIDADTNVRGRLAADLKLSTELRRANFTLTGNLKRLEWRR